MACPQDLLFTRDHEWIRIQPDGTARAGICDFAQEHLGDIVFVELPAVGKTFKQKDVFAVVESVKAASDCYCPAGGTVKEVNSKLVDEPATINKDPYGEGWMMDITVASREDLRHLMKPDEYDKYVAEGGGH